MENLELEKTVKNTQEKLEAIRSNIESVVRGKSGVVELSLVALLAGGHLLLEDSPGVGKTLLALSLAKSVDALFRRVQFTNDTIPSDIIGSQIFSRTSEKMEFIPGPIFANIVLADEINRTSPKTQSALLEAMAEGRISVENEVFELPQPFMVVATQNPLEQQGTFPLPENQLDRFLIRASIGYPSREAEMEILEREIDMKTVDDIGSVLSMDDVSSLRVAANKVKMDKSLLNYLLDIVEATRRDERIELPVSPRGALMLKKAAKALALVRGRDYVTPDDIKRLAVPVLSHRIVPRGNAGGVFADRTQAESLINTIVESIEVPL